MTMALLATSVSFAQPGRGMGPCGGANMGNAQAPDGQMQCRIPDLTEDQQTKIDALRVEHYKAVQPLRNQLNEIQAKYRTLMTTDPVDTKAVDKLIDERTSLMNKMMKLNAAHRAQVRSLLTDEQKISYDRMGSGRGMGMGQRGPRGQRGFGGGYGNCPMRN